MERSPLGLADPDLEVRLGGVVFWAVTFRLFKVRGLEEGEEDYGQAARYLGTIPGCHHHFRLDAENPFETGRTVRIGGNTARILRASRLAPHFQVLGDDEGVPESWAGTLRYRTRLRDTLYLGLVHGTPILLTSDEQIAGDEHAIFRQIRSQVDWGQAFQEPPVAIVVDGTNAHGEGRRNLARYEESLSHLPIGYRLVLAEAPDQAPNEAVILDARRPFAEPRFAAAGGPHVAAMRAGRPGTFEYELEAVTDYTFRRHGGVGPGYGTIVGAGENATILHYVENRCALADGDLVLVDAGCEYGHYTADITRTWPAAGTFTAAQREVYELVVGVQKSAVAMTRRGVTLDELHQHCVRGLTEGMIALGLLEGTVDARVEDLAYKKYYMHGTSHWLGMDVHDVGAYTRDGKPRPLEPGMVITVEPGLYIPADAPGVPDRLRGIGVRIEDDVLVTADGHDNLTAACPNEVADLEAICRS